METEENKFVGIVDCSVICKCKSHHMIVIEIIMSSYNY